MSKTLSVIDVGALLRSGAIAGPTERTLEFASALAHFLETNQLLLRNVLGPTGQISRDEIITEADLTDEGLALFWGQFIDKWMAGIDRGKPFRDFTVMERGLEKIHDIGAPEFLKTTRYYLYHKPTN